MKKILLLTAGGSIVSDKKRVGKGKQPVAIDTNLLLETIPEIGKIAEVTVREVFREDTENFTQTQWTQLAQEIYRGIGDLY